MAPPLPAIVGLVAGLFVAGCANEEDSSGEDYAGPEPEGTAAFVDGSSDGGTDEDTTGGEEPAVDDPVTEQAKAADHGGTNVEEATRPKKSRQPSPRR